ncbi:MULTISPECIES: hypothetical protein [unclassified Exiguobacterium]|uniref:hypothetical protein n=1 Tax=unclassified Exiguobacterium TaxID=2644629 RepID=UPI001BED215B|nr:MULTISPECIES: hypothetical protein [unclassified Exiguobacterium]
MLEQVRTFINANILFSDLWDSADEAKKQKAVNNALIRLLNYYGQYDEDTIPAEAVAYQALWLLQIDDSFRRAEQGVTSISVSGTSISLSQIDRSIAPDVIRLLGRRIGRYDLKVSDTYRHRTNPKYAKRGF